MIQLKVWDIIKVAEAYSLASGGCRSDQCQSEKETGETHLCEVIESILAYGKNGYKAKPIEILMTFWAWAHWKSKERTWSCHRASAVGNKANYFGAICSSQGKSILA